VATDDDGGAPPDDVDPAPGAADMGAGAMHAELEEAAVLHPHQHDRLGPLVGAIGAEADDLRLFVDGGLVPEPGHPEPERDEGGRQAEQQEHDLPIVAEPPGKALDGVVQTALPGRVHEPMMLFSATALQP
jgi:hypothetical protein